jgi:hypothetical protein
MRAAMPEATHAGSANQKFQGKKKPRRHLGAAGVQFLGSQDLVENACRLLFIGLFSQRQF